MTTIEHLTKTNNDANGNPRYIVHFLQIDNDYDKAVKKANTIGGRKHHTKAYGGGIIFQSYNVQNLVNRINELRNN